LSFPFVLVCVILFSFLCVFRFGLLRPFPSKDAWAEFGPNLKVFFFMTFWKLLSCLLAVSHAAPTLPAAQFMLQGYDLMLGNPFLGKWGWKVEEVLNVSSVSPVLAGIGDAVFSIPGNMIVNSLPLSECDPTPVVRLAFTTVDVQVRHVNRSHGSCGCSHHAAGPAWLFSEYCFRGISIGEQGNFFPCGEWPLFAAIHSRSTHPGLFGGSCHG
jgi:hypothetical protein